MAHVEGARMNSPGGERAPVSRVEVSYWVGYSVNAGLEREQIEVLAELVACRLLQFPQDRARDERRQLLTARQAAEILAVDLKTMYRHAKELGDRKVGGTWRFDLDPATLDSPTESSARYASERPQRAKPPVARRGKRIGVGSKERVHCHLLPVGRASDRDAAK
jgi:hypothetical protein